MEVVMTWGLWARFHLHSEAEFVYASPSISNVADGARNLMDSGEYPEVEIRSMSTGEVAAITTARRMRALETLAYA